MRAKPKAPPGSRVLPIDREPVPAAGKSLRPSGCRAFVQLMGDAAAPPANPGQACEQNPKNNPWKEFALVASVTDRLRCCFSESEE
jgi:hypothetical protein